MEENVLLAMGDEHKRAQFHKLLGEMLVNVSNKYFENQDIFVDGYRFINCRFKNVTFYVLRGTFEFHNCSIEGGRRFFGEEAQKCVQLMMLSLNHLPTTTVDPSLRAQFSPNGTFSIGKGASC